MCQPRFHGRGFDGGVGRASGQPSPERPSYTHRSRYATCATRHSAGLVVMKGTSPVGVAALRVRWAGARAWTRPPTSTSRTCGCAAALRAAGRASATPCSRTGGWSGGGSLLSPRQNRPLTGRKICKQPLDEGFHPAVLSQHGTASESEFGYAPALGDNAAVGCRWVAQGLCRSCSEGYSPVPAT